MRLYRFVTLYTLMQQYTQVMLLVVVTLSFQSLLYTKSACVIIHGTWARNETWYRPGGAFFQSVSCCNDELKTVDEVVSFSWSGKLGYPAQLEAAQQLVNFVEQYDSVIFVAHSHGATVGIICSQILSKNDTYRNNCGKIAKFYALGVPVNQSTINPDMYSIHTFYNLFSFGDVVQTVNGTYNRVFYGFDRVVNVAVELFNLHPSHTELHHPSIGMYLLKIDEYFGQKKIGRFDTFVFDGPGHILFQEYEYPKYTIQHDQEKLLQEDKYACELANLAFFRAHVLQR